MTPTTAKQITVDYLKDPMKRVEVEWSNDDLLFLIIRIGYPMLIKRDPEQDPQIAKDDEIEWEHEVVIVDAWASNETELINKLELLTFKECKYE